MVMLGGGVSVSLHSHGRTVDMVAEDEGSFSAVKRLLARQIFEAFAYQLAKDVGSMAPVVNGKIDRIVLTGGIAYSDKFTKLLAEKVRFIAPVEIWPGSMEQDALGLGILRVL